jgi:hypothetical protein
MPAPSKAELRKQRGKEQITCECGSTLSRNGMTAIRNPGHIINYSSRGEAEDTQHKHIEIFF